MKTYTIGRDLGCDIVINDTTDVVSRRHAVLQVGGVGSRSYGAVRGFGCEKHGKMAIQVQNNTIIVYFCSVIVKTNRIMSEFKSIQKWIEAKAIRGHYVFTKEEVRSAFPALLPTSITQSVSRLLAAKTIVSPWQNFYVIVPMEYKLKGIVPPVFYMDSLMNYLERPYYVALLNAAEMYGAAHQRPQNFTVFTEGTSLRSSGKTGVELRFFSRRRLPIGYVRKFQTQMGYVNVASPELTALDLVHFEQEVGGLTRTATVLAELAEELRFSTIDPELLGFFGVATVQRLGYLLENVIGETEKADELMELSRSWNQHFRRVALKSSKSVSKTEEVNKKWKVIVNQQIEIDELLI